MVGGGQEGAGAILIPSVAFTPGFRDGGGQRLMPVNMQQLPLIWGMVTLAMVATTPPMPLIGGSKLLSWGRLYYNERR